MHIQISISMQYFSGYLTQTNKQMQVKNITSLAEVCATQSMQPVNSFIHVFKS